MNSRLYENLRHWIPGNDETEGKFGIPRIQPGFLPEEIEAWLPFNDLSRRLTKTEAVQMYVDDYRIERLWNAPTKYLGGLRNSAAVLSPDFSIYADVPQALGIYNHYRKHWLGAFWQLNGINVIPTICWGDESTFDWCFDGEPQNAIVSVSSVGTQRGQGAKAAFMRGYDAMLERLNPSGIIFFGNVPAEARGNIIHVDTFYKRFEKRREERARNQS